MSTAVSMVMCNEPVMRTPWSGRLVAYFFRIDMRPGISCSETWMVLRPQSARLRSLTLKSALPLPLLAVRRFLAVLGSFTVAMGVEWGGSAWGVIGYFTARLGAAALSVRSPEMLSRAFT